MVMSFPRLNRFATEYEINRPWSGENLIAPFDFPIYKTAEDLKTEQDSVRKHFLQYFKADSVKRDDIRRMVYKALNNNTNKFEVLCPNAVIADSVKAYVGREMVKNLYEIYARGLVELPTDIDTRHDETYELMVVRGNVVEPYELNELLTYHEAYTEIKNNVDKSLLDKYGETNTWTATLLKHIPFDELLVANVCFDKNRSTLELNNRLSNISLTSGMVMSGQKIIGTGDIVDKESLQILDSLKKTYENKYDIKGVTIPILMGEFFMVMCLLLSVYLFLRYFRKDIFGQLHCVNFILLMMTIFVMGAGIIASRHGNISFIIPFVILPIFLRIFLDSRLAMYVHVITIIIVSFFAYSSQLFVLLHIPAGMIAIISLVHMTRRMQIVRTAVMVVVCYIVTYSGYCLWRTGEWDSINTTFFVMFAVNGMLLLLSYPSIYVFEKIFGFLSEVTLVELADTNGALLRELSEKAPGTFQHSVQVSNLAQEVAYEVGANAMLVKVGALYHDIGKIVAPMYFTENQVAGINPHNDLNYKESANIIIAHVENGAKIAKKHNLPQAVIDFIYTHHGTSTARYFYVAWCNEHQNEEIDKKIFSYTGPAPKTKEQAILMMADAVEASSKSLTNYTDESIDTLVDKIIAMQIENNQFDKAEITFKDIDKAKVIFKNKLKNIYRSRIQYPELMK
jgi:putative nucleotidyltransferase with HDIG domain